MKGSRHTWALLGRMGEWRGRCNAWSGFSRFPLWENNLFFLLFPYFMLFPSLSSFLFFYLAFELFLFPFLSSFFPEYWAEAKKYWAETHWIGPLFLLIYTILPFSFLAEYFSILEWKQNLGAPFDDHVFLEWKETTNFRLHVSGQGGPVQIGFHCNWE